MSLIQLLKFRKVKTGLNTIPRLCPISKWFWVSSVWCVSVSEWLVGHEQFWVSKRYEALEVYIGIGSLSIARHRSALVCSERSAVLSSVLSIESVSIAQGVFSLKHFARAQGPKCTCANCSILNSTSGNTLMYIQHVKGKSKPLYYDYIIACVAWYIAHPLHVGFTVVALGMY